MTGSAPEIWKDGIIPDCLVRPLRHFGDDRGWLAEIFRDDELPASVRPAMAYLSLTHGGIARGPHEHEFQTDIFAFFDGEVRVWLWDTRPDSPTCGVRQVQVVGTEHPVVLVIPPGVVHAYRNESARDVFILNCPDRLYGGPGRADGIDEIRHEDQPDSPFQLDN